MTPQNRVVVLTGATKGIGRATAFALAGAGCKLALAARNVDTLQTLADELNSAGHQSINGTSFGGVRHPQMPNVAASEDAGSSNLDPQCIAIPTDMGDTSQAAALAQKTVDHFGKIDVVINNAGIGVRDDVVNLQETEARRVMDVNYFGPLALIQAAIPHLKANPDGGLIINVSSIVGRRAMPGISGYCASKGALEKMADSLRLELKPTNIRVSTVYPGVTQTAFNSNSLGGSQQGRGRVSGVPPEKVAQAILKTIRKERRDVFITLFDYAFVTGSMLLPGLMDWMLGRYLER